MKKSGFQFTNPRLVSFTYQENENPNSNENFEMPCTNNINIKKATDNSAIVSFMFEIGNVEETNFHIVAIIEANFKWDDSFPSDMIDNMLKVNASSLLLSYLRPLIATLTYNTKFGAINIPFMDFRNALENNPK